jgi:hypothetical protein
MRIKVEYSDEMRLFYRKKGKVIKILTPVKIKKRAVIQGEI